MSSREEIKSSNDVTYQLETQHTALVGEKTEIGTFKNKLIIQSVPLGYPSPPFGRFEQLKENITEKEVYGLSFLLLRIIMILARESLFRANAPARND